MFRALAILCLLGAVCADKFPKGDFGDNVGMKPGKMPKNIGLLDEDETDVVAQMLDSCPADQPDCFEQHTMVEAGDIIGPKYHPGETMRGTDMLKIDEALEDVLKAGDIGHDRRCAIGVSDYGTGVTSNPHYYISSGGAQGPLPPEIKKGYTGFMLYVKTIGTARGTVGVVTYDLEGTDKKLAIMWSVPFDWNLYYTWMNIKLYPKSMATDKDMYEQMYYYAGPHSPDGGYFNRVEFGSAINATMNESNHAKLTVWVNTENHDDNGTPELAADCDYHWGWVGHYCWQETYPKGWCWINRKCKHYSDCQTGPYNCY